MLNPTWVASVVVGMRPRDRVIGVAVVSTPASRSGLCIVWATVGIPSENE